MTKQQFRYSYDTIIISKYLSNHYASSNSNIWKIQKNHQNILALPSGNPSEQPCKPLENPVDPSSFTWVNPIFKNI